MNLKKKGKRSNNHLCFNFYCCLYAGRRQLFGKEIKSIKSFYLAEAGIEYGIWKLKDDNP